MLESCQRGFVNREVEWSDLSRGMKSEQPLAMTIFSYALSGGDGIS
jgi:hypothetical protein